MNKRSHLRTLFATLLSLTLLVSAAPGFVFAEDSSLPASWGGQDIGDVAIPGDASYDTSTDSFTVKGAGDIWERQDSLHYVYKPMMGNGSISAKVYSMTLTDGWDKAGVMIRESLDPGSKNALISITDGQGIIQQDRKETGGDSEIVHWGDADAEQVPIWVKLERIGDIFNGYTSVDGENWDLVESVSIPMNQQVYYGLAVCNDQVEDQINTVVFNHVTVDMDHTAPSIPSGLASEVGDSLVQLHWKANSDADLAKYNIYRDGTLIGSTTETSYRATGLTNGTAYAFSVSAVDTSENESGLSEAVSATPLEDHAAPSWDGATLTAPDVTESTVHLNWSAAQDNLAVKQYKVYQNGSLLATVPADVQSYDVTGLTQVTSYTFKVEAGDLTGNWSTDGPSIDITTTNDIYPPTFQNPGIAVSILKDTSLRLGWTAATDRSGVKEYKVFQNGVEIASVDGSATVATVTGLTPNTTYRFKVEASDTYGNWTADGPELTVTTTASANWEDIQLPADGNIIDVTKAPYNAKGDGLTDDTTALQAAIDACASWAGGEIYLPNGTYVVSKSLQFREPFTRTVIQGQSKSGTILKLKDNADGFDNPNDQQSVFTAFPDPNESTGNSFTNGMYNLTVDVGSGNPGAIGIQFMENNQGGIRDVLIKSSDPQGAGAIGLDLTHNWVGPGMYKNIEINGFDYGIKVKNDTYSQVLENVTLNNQHKYGVYNDGNVMTFNNLISNNMVPAIVNAGGTGLLTVLNSTLSGGAKDAIAIDNQKGQIFARNVKAFGYQAVLKNGSTIVPGHTITEYNSMGVQSAFSPHDRSLNLPLEATPEIAYDPLDQWANVVSYGADPKGNTDSAKAVQAAIDSGASTIYFPHGNYMIDGTVHVHGNVKMITGLDGSVFAGDTLGTSGSPMFQFDSGTAATVVIENMLVNWTDNINFNFVNNNTPQTLVIRNVDVGPSAQSYRNTSNAGKLFVEDVCGTNWTIDHEQVWMRQINPEWGGPHILNNGGKLAILGLKSEGDGTVVDTENGGQTEILGGLIYPAWITDKNNNRVQSLPQPAFVNNNSSVTIEVAENYYSSWSSYYPVVVEETQDGVTKQLTHDDFPARGEGVFMGLYNGYAGHQRGNVNK